MNAFRKSWPDFVPGRTNWFRGLPTPLPPPGRHASTWHLALCRESAQSPQAGLPALIPKT